MKRILTLIATLMLLLSAALADAPAYSPEMTALKIANALMYEKYGFTIDTLGVFTPTVTTTEPETRVRFHSYFLPGSRLGEYEAVIVGDEVALTWTHDDKAPALLQSGDPESPCWGPKQIQTYFDQGLGHRDDWIKPYYAEGEEAQDEPTSVWLELNLTRVPAADTDLSREETKQIAAAALMDIYCLTTEELDALDVSTEKPVLLANDGRRFRQVNYSDTIKCFQVLVNTENGEVFHIYLFSGGNG